jgi:hypothetical protein
MKDIEIVFDERPKLAKPVFVEGLPGVGNVGKIAIEHLIAEMKPRRFANLYSKHFPPQVMVDEHGLIRLVDNQFFYLRRKGKADILSLTGDYQGLTPEGQYEVSDAIVDVCKGLGCKRIITLGGFSVGKLVTKPRVIGAATSKKLVDEAKEHGVVFSGGEPGSGILGASGLLLALGKMRGMEGICLMGETSGFIADPKAAEAVLRVVVKLIDHEIGFADLEERAAQLDKITARLAEVEGPAVKPGKEELSYIS